MVKRETPDVSGLGGVPAHPQHLAPLLALNVKLGWFLAGLTASPVRLCSLIIQNRTNQRLQRPALSDYFHPHNLQIALEHSAVS